MKYLLASLVGLLSIGIIGCYNPVLEPLPTYTPYPTPEARVVVATPTPSPADNWMCFNAQIEVVHNAKIFAIGEQIFCAKDWRISNLYGPVGHLDENPDTPLTFRSLREAIEEYHKPVSNY